MISRMAVRGILFLTLFTVMCVADPTVKIMPWCPCGPRNLALGAQAVQSSTYDNLTAAENAVDGNRNSILDGGSCSQTREERNPWWRVDLREVFAITRVSITNRGDGFSERINGAQIRIGNRNSIFNVGSCSQTNGEMNPWWRIDLLEFYEVTRVRITNRGDGFSERINGAQIRIGNSLDHHGNNELAATVKSMAPGETKTFEFKPILGRYVNIFIPGRSEYLTLCEVEVFGEKYTSADACAPRNLALGAQAVQSSTFDILTAAENAVDGNRNSIMDGGSCSQTTEERNPWWRVDLLEVSEVTRVSITNRGDGFAERIIGAQIRIGNNLDNNGNNNELAATIGSIPAGETKIFTFRPIKGRYVNIFIPKLLRKEFLTLCEVEVYADRVE